MILTYAVVESYIYSSLHLSSKGLKPFNVLAIID